MTDSATPDVALESHADKPGEAKYPGKPVVINGNGAVAHVMKHVCGGVIGYPITPSTEISEIYEAARAEGGSMETNLLALAIDAARAKATVGEIYQIQDARTEHEAHQRDLAPASPAQIAKAPEDGGGHLAVRGEKLQGHGGGPKKGRQGHPRENKPLRPHAPHHAEGQYDQGRAERTGQSAHGHGAQSRQAARQPASQAACHGQNDHGKAGSKGGPL